MSAFDTAGTNWAFTFHFRECYTVSCKITQRKRHPNGVSDGWRIFLGIYALKRDRKERNVEIQTLKAAELKTAEYNPRRDLQPEDAEYQKLRRSIEEFGYVEPIIWNERTGRVVGGHQRLKVLLEKGAEEIEAVVVDLDEKNEKILNVLLNKVKGRWDIGKLADLLQELDEAGAMDLTGFEDWELQSLLMQYDHIKDLMEEDFSGYDDGKERSTFTMTFSLPAGARETVEEYMKTKENAKAEMATAIINKVKGVL